MNLLLLVALLLVYLAISRTPTPEERRAKPRLAGKNRPKQLEAETDGD